MLPLRQHSLLLVPIHLAFHSRTSVDLGRYVAVAQAELCLSHALFLYAKTFEGLAFLGLMAAEGFHHPEMLVP